MPRAAVKPELIRWAHARVPRAADDLPIRFPKLAEWESGRARPTFSQLEAFAKAARVPFGYLFLPEPPTEPAPIPDFRTVKNRGVGVISPDLRETIYTMQRRQGWLHDERVEDGADPVDFFGGARLSDNPEEVGREMRRALGLNGQWAASVGTWQQAVSQLRQRIEDFGMMAVVNGIVGNDTHRQLDVDEFRGFALSDELAPLIFVNGADAKSAQMFTLAHELAHTWLGKAGEGLSGFADLQPAGNDVETFCDRAAAEFLVPAAQLKGAWPGVKREESRFKTLARSFKVSPIVAARRAKDLQLIEPKAFFDFYNAYTQREQTKRHEASGGDFYLNQNTRVGQLFAIEVIRAAKEGRIGFKQAYDLTGLHGGSFQTYSRHLGVELP